MRIERYFAHLQSVIEARPVLQTFNITYDTRNLPTYPHHKHDGGEDNVTASSPPDLADVLREVQTLLALPA